MAGKVRHMINRSGRYHARLVVLKDLRAIVGKSDLRAPLGGDYREALKLLPGEVARLQHQIAQAELKAGAGKPQSGPAHYPLTPDAGTVKAGSYPDVPLHPQIIAEGFAQFMQDAAPGPMFNSGTEPETYRQKSSQAAGRLRTWLDENKLTPEGLQPNHAWRHRFKTVTRELAISDRVVDAIQYHSGKTAPDSYGDVTLKTKTNAINKLPAYDPG